MKAIQKTQILSRKRTRLALDRVSSNSQELLLGGADLARAPASVRELVAFRLGRNQDARVSSLPVIVNRHDRPIPPRIATLPRQRRFPMTIDFSREDVRLPFGVPRFVNARTLRLMAGGSPFDQLLKKVGPAWEFVEDNTRIDLTNPREEFRLGRLTIFS